MMRAVWGPVLLWRQCGILNFFVQWSVPGPTEDWRCDEIGPWPLPCVNVNGLPGGCRGPTGSPNTCCFYVGLLRSSTLSRPRTASDSVAKGNTCYLVSPRCSQRWRQKSHPLYSSIPGGHDEACTCLQTKCTYMRTRDTSIAQNIYFFHKIKMLSLHPLIAPGSNTMIQIEKWIAFLSHVVFAWLWLVAGADLL